MHAALKINMPNYASAIVSTREVVDAISSSTFASADELAD